MDHWKDLVASRKNHWGPLEGAELAAYRKGAKRAWKEHLKRCLKSLKNGGRELRRNGKLSLLKVREKPYPCDSAQCDLMFDRPGAMRVHWKKFHLSPDAWEGLPFGCPAMDCYRKYRVKGKLREHMRNAHYSVFTSQQIEYELSLL